MSPFEFITVFVSLIVGFALAHILRAVSDLYEIRERVKTYWLNSLWVVTVIMWSIFTWWGLWMLSIDLTKWTYVQYWILVINVSSIYFFTTLVLPKATDEGMIDLENHYYSVRLTRACAYRRARYLDSHHSPPFTRHLAQTSARLTDLNGKRWTHLRTLTVLVP